MELSAFAHMSHRNVKVIQPGLVYVIEWDGGGDPNDLQQRRKGKSIDLEDNSDDEDEDSGPVYVA